MLLRSDDPHGLTAEDLVLLAEMGLSTVIDLRMRAEVDAVGGAALWAGGGVRRVWFDLMPQLAEADDATVLSRVLPPGRSDGRTVGGLYGEFVARAPAAVAGAVRAIAAADGAVLVHCAAGKDRTGVVIAVALALAGARPEAIVADYRRTDERIEAIRERLLASAFYGPEVSGRSLDSMRARSEHLEGFLAVVEESHGGVDGLAAAIGLEPETGARLRQRLLSGV